MEGWDKVVPQFLREMLSSLDPKARDAVEELRLREGFPLAVVQAGEVGLPLWPFGCPTLCRGWRALCCPSWRRGENSPIP